MFSVYELLVFPPRNLDIPRIGHDDVVTAIHYRSNQKPGSEGLARTGPTAFVIDGFVLAHEHERDPLREFSEYPVRRIDVVPYPSVGKRCLSFVFSSSLTLEKRNKRRSYITNGL